MVLTQVWIGLTDSDTPGWWYWASTLESPDIEGPFNIWSPDSTKVNSLGNGAGLHCIAADLNANAVSGKMGDVLGGSPAPVHCSGPECECSLR